MNDLEKLAEELKLVNPVFTEIVRVIVTRDPSAKMDWRRRIDRGYKQSISLPLAKAIEEPFLLSLLCTGYGFDLSGTIDMAIRVANSALHS